MKVGPGSTRVARSVEARDRCRSAIINTGLDWPGPKNTVGLSPAELPKRGPTLDLAIALENSRLDQIYNTPALATLYLFEDQVRWMNAQGGLPWCVARCETSSAILYSWAARSAFATPFVEDPAMRSSVVGTIDLLPDELLRRTRHGLELDGHGWDVDVWRFWDLTDGDDDDKAQAIELYQSDLAARQLAYDDMLEEQRDLLRRRWIDTVRALVGSGRLSASEARTRAHRLGGSAEDELAET